MLYTEFKAGEHIYKLRLTTSVMISLEKALGMPLLMVFGANGDRVPSLTEMVTILHYSMQTYQHGNSLSDTYNIFDEWLADGNVVTDFISVIVDIYQSAGLFKNSTKEETEKN